MHWLAGWVNHIRYVKAHWATKSLCRSLNQNTLNVVILFWVNAHVKASRDSTISFAFLPMTPLLFHNILSEPYKLSKNYLMMKLISLKIFINILMQVLITNDVGNL